MHFSSISLTISEQREIHSGIKKQKLRQKKKKQKNQSIFLNNESKIKEMLSIVFLNNAIYTLYAEESLHLAIDCVKILTFVALEGQIF